MDVINFILMYFASKNLSLLTAFLCWSTESTRQLATRGAATGLRLRLRLAHAAVAAPALPAEGARREAALLDLSCPAAPRVLREASSSRAFNLRYSWLLLHDGAYNESSLRDVLSEARALPDGDVAALAGGALLDLYRVAAGQPLLLATLAAAPPRARRQLDALWAGLPTAVARRKDLRNVYIKSATIVSQPQYFRGWGDVSNRHIDTYPKLTYPLLVHAAEDLHFRMDMMQVELYGEEHNGSFDGLAGLLEAGRVELGVASMFMRADRWRVLHFCCETVVLRGAFMFRQPSRSAVSNVFLLPFSRGVWAAAAATLAGAAALLALAGRAAPRDPDTSRLTPAESFTFVIGAICQQGSHLSPGLVAVRLLMFCTLLASLFAFTSYSAKIVAILQAPSDAIRTVEDLTNSPMAMGIQETTYKRVYFAESTDPATRALFRRKLQPLGERAYLSVVDGVARLRTGLFAFQVEQGSGYDIISKTFTEREKCGLHEIPAFTLPMVAVPLRRHSGLRDLLAARLRWQREVGIVDRYRRVWMAARPACGAGGGGFASVGLRDVTPAAHALLAGAAAAAALLLAERAAHRLRRRPRRPRQQRY